MLKHVGPAGFEPWTLPAHITRLIYSIHTEFDPATRVRISTGPAVWLLHRQSAEKALSEVGFEPTPTEVDCDLNAAP